MAISAGGRRGRIRNEINITPLIDVLLVLLIIFMVLTPFLQLGFESQLPPTAPATATHQEQLIVRIDGAGSLFINRRQVLASAFTAELRSLLQGRENRLVFFAADGELPYERVTDFLESVRSAGAENLGIVFDDLTAN